MKTKLKLTGVDGNAFSIMGKAQSAAKKDKWTEEKIKEYLDKAMSGDYNNLLKTTMEYFEVD